MNTGVAVVATALAVGGIVYFAMKSSADNGGGGGNGTIPQNWVLGAYVVPIAGYPQSGDQEKYQIITIAGQIYTVVIINGLNPGYYTGLTLTELNTRYRNP